MDWALSSYYQIRFLYHDDIEMMQYIVYGKYDLSFTAGSTPTKVAGEKMPDIPLIDLNARDVCLREFKQPGRPLVLFGMSIR